MAGKYDDILNMPHHVSKTRPHMSIYDRAAQFSPFAALTGHSAAIEETARLTDKESVLTEYETEKLNAKIQLLSDNLKFLPEVSVTYFQPDSAKSGGSYTTLTGRVKKIDWFEKEIIFTDDTFLSIDSIHEISGDIFSDLEWF